MASATRLRRGIESHPSSSDGKTQLTFFSNPPRMLPVHDVIHIPYLLSGIFILTSVNDTSSPHVRQHLRSSLHLTNPCAKRKVLSLTKPKGKTYKTKSLSHYITVRQHTKSDNFSMLFICAFPCWRIDNILNPQYVLGSTYTAGVGLEQKFER